MGSVGAASLCKSSRVDKTAIVIRKVFQIVLWLAAGAYGVVGVLTITGALGGSREADSLSRAYIVFGSLFLMIGVMAAVATLFANKWRGWLIVAALILSLGLPLGLFAAFWIDMEKGEVHRRQMEEEVRSGKWDFGDQPALLAVAQAISANDQDAIRAAAKAVPRFAGARAGRDDAALLGRQGNVAASAISRIGENVVVARRRPELHERQTELIRDGQLGACVGARSPRDAGGGRKSEHARRAGPANDPHELVFGLLPKSGQIAT